MNAPLIIPELVSLDADLGSTKAEVITSVAGIIARAGRADADGLTRDALDRESKSPTGMPGGFAIPHCRSAAVSQPSLGFARLSPAVDFNGPDGPADLVFMIAASENGGADHMKLLTKLARALVKPEFVEQLRQAPDAQTVVDLIGGVVGPEEGTRHRRRDRRNSSRTDTHHPRRRHHSLSDRHRPHLHGRRLPHGRGQEDGG